jgi:hypothetical protein
VSASLEPPPSDPLLLPSSFWNGEDDALLSSGDADDCSELDDDCIVPLVPASYPV